MSNVYIIRFAERLILGLSFQRIKFTGNFSFDTLRATLNEVDSSEEEDVL